MVTNIHEHKKDITIPFTIHYYLLRAFRNTTHLHANHNVRFSCQHWAKRYTQYVRAKPCVNVSIISLTPPQRNSRQGCDIVNPGIQ